MIFTDVIAPSSWTSPSMVSLFTSVYPINHGVVHGFMGKKKVYNQEVFSSELETIAEILKKQGYTTFGVSSNLHLSEEYGFARGFDYFTCVPFLAAPSVNEIAYSWKDAIKKSSKFFLWIHYFDPHWTYTPRVPWIEHYEPNYKEIPRWFYKMKLRTIQKGLGEVKELPSLDTLIALYDSEINYVDNYVKALVKNLQLLDNAIFIITSDHGEAFLEHGMLDHGMDLHAETVNVPLIVKLPQQKTKKVIYQQVSLLDILPTLLTLLDVPPSGKMFGKSFLTSDGKENKIANRYLYAELERGNRNMKAIFLNNWKYIHNGKGTIAKIYDWLKNIVLDDWKYLFKYEDRVVGLYDRKQDPHEKLNLIKENTSLSTDLKEQLFEWMNAAHRYPVEKISVTPSQEMQDKLKALGYITEKDYPQ
jgi:arylsulfatase A-like enzyme